MSKPDPPPGWKVGYGQPPFEHRFKKGKSGNPKGRPRNKPSLETLNFSNKGNQAAKVILKEAFRILTLREGTKTIRLSTIQAVTRSMATAAIKGNCRAQRDFTALVQYHEKNEHNANSEFVQAAVKYKDDWELTIAQEVAEGRTPSDPVLHPDDIIFDLSAGDVHFNGPRTNEEKAAWNEKLERRAELQLDITNFAGSYRRARKPMKKAQLLDQWIDAQRSYDEINDNFPKRYRKQLENRCWKDGASTPGSQKTLHWLGE